jgi:hypothetical protein
MCIFARFIKFMIIKEAIYFRVLIFSILTAAWYVTVLTSCASTGKLLSGPIDKKPPVQDSLKSTPHFQTRFVKQDIIMFFDEYVEVKEATKQVLVSPPLVYLPKVTGRGKKVTFSFHESEVLRPDVTYTINFGEAIVDFHEGNKLTNFSYVFSTGAVLDSLTMSGNVYDAIDFAPIENVQVLLYDTFYDSIVAKEKPYYSTKTDKTGSFSFKNIKADTFKMLALVDKNVNLKYDLESEKIGFPDSLIVLDTSSQKTEHIILVSNPRVKQKLLAKNLKTYGVVDLVYNSNPEIVRPVSMGDQVKLYVKPVKDTLKVFYNTNLDSFDIIAGNDTIKIKTPSKDNKNKQKPLLLSYRNLSPNLLPSDSLTFQFSAPLDTLLAEKWSISDTLGEVGGLTFGLSENRMNVSVKGKWRVNMPYKVTFDSTSLTDIYGRTMDSTKLSFKCLSQNQTSALLLDFSSFDSTKHYFVMFKRGENILDTFSISQMGSFTKKYTSVVPDVYSLEVIEDKNRNSVWDPGNYWEKTQPEKMKIFKIERPEINRENEVPIKWSTPSDRMEELPVQTDKIKK